MSTAQGRQGHAPGMTPWSALPPLSGLGRAGGSAWAWRRRCCGRGWLTCGAKSQRQQGESGEVRGRGRRAADAWGPAAVTASERRTRGHGRRVLGRKLGRARALGEGGRGWQAGWRGGAGWAVKPSGPGPQRGFLLLFFFLFLFFISSPFV